MENKSLLSRRGEKVTPGHLFENHAGIHSQTLKFKEFCFSYVFIQFPVREQRGMRQESQHIYTKATLGHVAIDQSKKLNVHFVCVRLCSKKSCQGRSRSSHKSQQLISLWCC